MGHQVERASAFLADLGIQSETQFGNLLVSRTSMVQFFARSSEDDAYKATLEALRAEFPDSTVYWFGRTDDWLGLYIEDRVPIGGV